MQTGLTDSRTHTGMKIAFILADMERTVNIKWASHAAVCSWESMNSGKTFCQTPIDALRKRRCCHKCCEQTECTLRGSVPQSMYIGKGGGEEQQQKHMQLGSSNWSACTAKHPRQTTTGFLIHTLQREWKPDVI